MSVYAQTNKTTYSLAKLIWFIVFNNIYKCLEDRKWLEDIINFPYQNILSSEANFNPNSTRAYIFFHKKYETVLINVKKENYSIL